MNTEEKIVKKVTDALTPAQVVIENDSHRHAGHAGSPGTGDSHFNLTIISDKFDGLNRVARQRLVYDLLKEELEGPVHALALKCLTPDQAA